MKISKNCEKCIGTGICGADYGGSNCKDFHELVESKLHPDNTTVVSVMIESYHNVNPLRDVVLKKK